MLSTKAVEKATWKKFRLERDSNPWPCDTGAMLYPLSYQATWIDGHSRAFQLLRLKAHCEDHNFPHVYPQFTYMIFICSYLYIITIIGYMTHSRMTIYTAYCEDYNFTHIFYCNAVIWEGVTKCVTCCCQRTWPGDTMDFRSTFVNGRQLQPVI